MSTSNRGQCTLCREERALSQSHIIPKFVFKWQKETSPTQYLRLGENINRRSQDGVKVRLLCEECELKLSKVENIFKTRVFDKAINRRNLELSYSDWMAEFCVSIAWRGLLYLVEKGVKQERDGELTDLIESALENWRQFLLGKKHLLNRNPVHFFDIWQLHDAKHERIPGNWNRFINRHSVIRLLSDEKSGASTIFVKMGPVSVFGHIVAPKRKWIGTRVNSCNGFFSSSKVSLPSDLFFFLVNEAQQHIELVESLSPNQQDVISKAIREDLDRLTSSSAFVDLVADYGRFGNLAFSGKKDQKRDE